MYKNILSVSLIILGLFAHLYSPAQLNITFKSKLAFSGALSNVWGYAVNSREYALVGHDQGMSVVDVTDPVSPVKLFTAPGPNSIWREVRTKDNYAFVTTEGGGGLQIVDLSYLPDSIKYKSWNGNGAIAGQLNSIHALQVDGNYLYLYGSNVENNEYSGHPLIIDVTDPWNPNYVGGFVFPGTGSVSYVHDGYVRNDTGYFSHIYDGFFSIVNLSNKTNPVLLSSQNTPNNFTHNTWLSDNSKVLFTTDEVDNSYLTSYNITDPTDIIELDKIQQNPGSGSVVHNTYVLNDYAVTSWYKDGVVIVDASRPANLVITGYYDTSPLSGTGMDGDWGVYAFLPSGNLLISDIQEGLFVLTPNYQRGCYLEGTITDSTSGNSIFGATVSILTTTESTTSKSNGNYACGYGISGTYNIRVQKTGYVTKIINGVVLSNGVLTPLNVELVPDVAFTLTGLVKEDSSSSAIPFAEIEISTPFINYTVTADTNGFFTLPNIYSDNYDIKVGKWGFHTQCFSQAISSNSGGLLVELEKGYYDDFSFDFGWTIASYAASAGIWEIGKPLGTDFDGAPANPGTDADTDCSDYAFVTGNAGGSVGDDDIDGGKTVITSPVFDAGSYIDPYISYQRWFFNGGGYGNPNDSMKIKITNGTSTVTLETITANSLFLSAWVSKIYRISDFITPGADLRLIVEASDVSPGHIVEAGFDLFRVLDTNIVSVNEISKMESIQIYPNPTKALFEINFSDQLQNSGKVQVYNMIGEQVFDSGAIVFNKSIQIDLSQHADGIYFVAVKSQGHNKTFKLIKL